MKFEFDANQDYQRKAIDAVVKLFEGQSYVPIELRLSPDLETSAICNHLDLNSEQICANLQLIQEENNITGGDPVLNGVPNFSVEMETGTGKTYIYLRTALELSQHYGMRKFIIVVPSVAIREGVIKTFQITETHFGQVYDNLPYRYYVYDSEKLSNVRQFALSDSVEFMVITLASFNKALKNVIHKSTDRLHGEKPINLIQATRPILILDEPQNMESNLSVESLSKLSPLFMLRYSATHRKRYNCVYTLNPYDAYRQGLVKRIDVMGIESDSNINRAFVQVKGFRSQGTRLTAQLIVDKLMPAGRVNRTTLTVESGDDLGAARKTNLPEYEGYRVSGIEKGRGYVEFENGVKVNKGESHGEDKSVVFEAQIRSTIEEHFQKQASLKDVGIKVLSLFFIDKVDNYAKNGMIRQLFDKCFNELKQKEDYSAWQDKQPEDVQAAYFAQSRKQTGDIVIEDSKTGEAKKDTEAYQLIMQDKERLLSFDEPTCFIFSHSALREGWDSPNVFQICTLNQTASEVKKRQEIGRGVRLAVTQEGKRVHEMEYNVLTVVANESYRSYVEGLQTEVNDEFGAASNQKIPAQNARERGKAKLNKAMMLTPEFKELWERIKHKTRYKVDINTEKLIADVVDALNLADDIPERRIRVNRAGVVVGTEDRFDSQHEGESSFRISAPEQTNILKLIAHWLAQTTPSMRLTRCTLLEILKRTEKQEAALYNAPEFAQVVTNLIKKKIMDQLIDGIKYQKIGEAYEMRQFDYQIESWKACMVPAPRSLYNYVIWDSDVEKRFVEDLENRNDIKLYVKLPAFFTVPTPVGTYNPDWAIVKEDRDAHKNLRETLYLVAETKSTTDLTELRRREERKIRCGEKHFGDALDVDYKVVASADEI